MKATQVQQIRDDIDARMRHHPNSLAATDDEVSVCLLLAHIDDLDKIIAEVHAWAVCATITPPEDMMQNMGRIVTITTPGYDEFDAKMAEKKKAEAIQELQDIRNDSYARRSNSL